MADLVRVANATNAMKYDPRGFEVLGTAAIITAAWAYGGVPLTFGAMSDATIGSFATTVPGGATMSAIGTDDKVDGFTHKKVAAGEKTTVLERIVIQLVAISGAPAPGTPIYLSNLVAGAYTLTPTFDGEYPIGKFLFNGLAYLQANTLRRAASV